MPYCSATLSSSRRPSLAASFPSGVRCQESANQTCVMHEAYDHLDELRLASSVATAAHLLNPFPSVFLSSCHAFSAKERLRTLIAACIAEAGLAESPRCFWVKGVFWSEFMSVLQWVSLERTAPKYGGAPAYFLGVTTSKCKD